MAFEDTDTDIACDEGTMFLHNAFFLFLDSFLDRVFLQESAMLDVCEFMLFLDLVICFNGTSS